MTNYVSSLQNLEDIFELANEFTGGMHRSRKMPTEYTVMPAILILYRVWILQIYGINPCSMGVGAIEDFLGGTQETIIWVRMI